MKVWSLSWHILRAEVLRSLLVRAELSDTESYHPTHLQNRKEVSKLVVSSFNTIFPVISAGRRGTPAAPDAPRNCFVFLVKNM